MQHVVGFTSFQSAKYLSVIAIAMTLGMISGGLFSYLSKLLKIPLTFIVAVGIVIHIVTQIVIIMNYFSPHYIVWFVYGYFAQIALVYYAILAQYFGPQLSGRSITAINIFIFLFAFLVQYLFGLAIQLWSKDVGLAQPVIAYKVAFSGLVALEGLAFLWLVIRGKKFWQKTSKSVQP